MSAFDKVIGYDSIKEELLQIVDMMRNPALYEELGAKIPRGVMLIGDPGLGKSLMARCFVEESGLPCITLRRDKGGDAFTESIAETFREAKEKAPVVLLLDDMDKYVSGMGDESQLAAVQTGIDEVKDSGVFVIATVNDSEDLPESLTRVGRFDRRIEVELPSEEDSEKIVRFFLSQKKVDASVNVEDLCKMMSYNSCAELETIINEAAVYAAYERCKAIEMRHLVKAVLRLAYDAPDNNRVSAEEDRRRVAAHEAGHTVIAEMLVENSIGLASVRTRGGSLHNGFVHACKSHDPEVMVMVSLAGLAAEEMLCPARRQRGCFSDLRKARNILYNSIAEEGNLGLSNTGHTRIMEDATSERFHSTVEILISAEMERCMSRVRAMLAENRGLLEALQSELYEKETLLYSDIRRIREETKKEGEAA